MEFAFPKLFPGLAATFAVTRPAPGAAAPSSAGFEPEPGARVVPAGAGRWILGIRDGSLVFGCFLSLLFCAILFF